MVVFWLTRLKKNMTLPGESGFWILFSHTWGMSAHAHYIHSKECEINFTKLMATNASCFNRYFFTLVANKKLAL